MKYAPWLSAGVWLPARAVAPLDRLANDPQLAALAEDDPLVGGVRVPASFWRSMYRPPRFIAAEHVRKPVLLVHPGSDRWTPPHASLEFFARISAEKRAVILHGGGHYPIEPSATAHLEREVIAFIAGRGTSIARPMGRASRSPE